jgi:hypothetical protein
MPCWFHSLERGDFAQRWYPSPMKTLTGRQYSLKQLTQFKMLNKVLDPIDSNINDFLTRATVFLRLLQRRYFAQSWCSSPMKMLRDSQYSFNQLTQFKMLNKVLDPLDSNINDFLTRATVFLHSLQRGYFAQRWCSSPLKTQTGRLYSFKQLTQFTVINKC